MRVVKIVITRLDHQVLNRLKYRPNAFNLFDGRQITPIANKHFMARVVASITDLH